MTGKDETVFTDNVRQFDFYKESIDASLRKLLASVQLPKEAQQIDRAMEEFATRYHEYTVYAVAFSILLLHTDAHNKHVKRKMDKDTFISRTKIIEGGENVPAEILDIMYDNIVFSEFTYANDTTTRPERSNSWFFKFNTASSFPVFPDLKLKLQELMPAKNSYKYKQDIQIPIVDIHFSLLTARNLCLSGVRSRNETRGNSVNVKATKAGLLERKHELLPGGKRAGARHWRPFGLVLNESQIIFFSDLSSFQAWLDHDPVQAPPRRNSSFPHSISSLAGSNHGSTSSLCTSPPVSTAPQNVYLQPVQIITLAHAVCIYDDSYKKYPNTFRLITGDGNQYLLKAGSEKEMNDWMLKINYAASLKTTGVGIKLFKRRIHGSPGYDIDQQKRHKEAEEKARELSDRIEKQTIQLDRELQLRHNLMVIVPVQKSTRDRLLGFAQAVGERIKHDRIELQRLKCYKDYLESELAWCSLSQKDRKMSLPMLISNGKLLKGESIRGLSNLLFIPSSNSSDSSDSTCSNSSQLDSKKSPKLSFTEPVGVCKKTIDLERVMRRRSQSNPVVSNSEKILEQNMDKTGSESSLVKEDDSLSVITVYEESDEL